MATSRNHHAYVARRDHENRSLATVDGYVPVRMVGHLEDQVRGGLAVHMYDDSTTGFILIQNRAAVRRSGVGALLRRSAAAIVPSPVGAALGIRTVQPSHLILQDKGLRLRVRTRGDRDILDSCECRVTRRVGAI